MVEQQRTSVAEADRSVSVSELQTILERGKPVTVVDIRHADDREWTIPGSVAIDAYDAVKSGQLGALADVRFDARPVITVCGVGRNSHRAAELLRAQGIEALTLEGGMRAWSLAWNTAETTLAGGTQVVQVRRTGKGCLSYVIASKGSAVVVDTSVDAQVYTDLINARGWKLAAVLDTHIHADHLSRSKTLAEMTGASLYLPEQRRARFEFHGLADLDRIAFGDTELIAWWTPGHTAESTSYVIQDGAAFTGDTLFVDGVGRPDLQGDRFDAVRNARSLHGSIQRLLSLPPEALILPGHASSPVPFDRALLASTVRQIRDRRLLQLPELEFVAAVTQQLPPQPPNHSQIVVANEAAEWPAGATDLEAGANRCSVG